MTERPGIVEQLDGFDAQIRRELDTWLASEEGRVYRHGDLLVTVPDLFRLLVRLILDDRVPPPVRARLVAALIAVVSPADFLPESLLGPIGYEDDLLIMALVVFRVLEKLPQRVVIENWDGELNLLHLIPRVLDTAEEMVGPNLWRRLRIWVGEL